MKMTKYLLIAILAVVTFSACKQSDKKAEETQTNLPVNLKTSFIDIEGMTCEIGCAKIIESKISKIEGVSESKVDFESKKGTFTYDANKIVETDLIETINGLLDGKTYKATLGKAHAACCATDKVKECTEACAAKCGHKVGESCASDKKDSCCVADKVKECTEACAAKCGHKVGESCASDKKDSCCVTDKVKDRSKECAAKCEHKEGETCVEGSAKTEVCKTGCEKPCCATKNK